jgi:hypothetical protein
MRRTDKWDKAMKVMHEHYAKAQFSKATTAENDELYDSLQADGWFWNGKKREWEKLTAEQLKFKSTGPSEFSDSDGSPNGIFKLRVMAHREQVWEIIHYLQTILNVGEVSQDDYENRHGPGTRVYLTCRYEEKVGNDE